MFKDTIAIFAAFIILFIMAVTVKVPLEQLADPTDSNYVPRPDWYFLFLFQILKLFEGPLEMVGTVILPGLAFLALLSVPFVDRGELRRLRHRTLAIGVTFFTALGWTGLTATAILTNPKTDSSGAQEGETIQEWQQLSPAELAGIAYYRDEKCASCHNLKEGTPKVGPNLTTAAIRRSPVWMIEHFKHPVAVSTWHLDASDPSQ